MAVGLRASGRGHAMDLGLTGRTVTTPDGHHPRRREHRFTQARPKRRQTPLYGLAQAGGPWTPAVREAADGCHARANDGGSMYAVFVEVNADASQEDQARQIIQETIVPMARDAGARAGYWLSSQGGRGVSVTVFDSEQAASRQADRLKVGEAPPGAPPGVTFRTVEVREVLASL
jgi:hypothetical protein